MPIPILHGAEFTLRPWNADDAESLVTHASNKQIARNLRDGFPYPYRLEDAVKWLGMVNENKDDIILAIEINEEAAGGIGLHGMKDVYRFNAEIGYWLSESYWGRGIISNAVGLMVEFAFTKSPWLRIFAAVYENNLPSMRVLKRNGFVKEAVHRKAVMKEGKLMDEYLYALLKENWKIQEESGSAS